MPKKQRQKAVVVPRRTEAPPLYNPPPMGPISTPVIQNTQTKVLTNEAPVTENIREIRAREQKTKDDITAARLNAEAQAKKDEWNNKNFAEKGWEYVKYAWNPKNW